MTGSTGSGWSPATGGPPVTLTRSRRASRRRSAQALAQQLGERRGALAEIAAARAAWEAQTAERQEQARQAAAELDRRGIQHEDPEPQPGPVAAAEPVSEPEQPQPGPRAAGL